MKKITRISLAALIALSFGCSKPADDSSTLTPPAGDESSSVSGSSDEATKAKEAEEKKAVEEYNSAYSEAVSSGDTAACATISDPALRKNCEDEAAKAKAETAASADQGAKTESKTTDSEVKTAE